MIIGRNNIKYSIKYIIKYSILSFGAICLASSNLCASSDYIDQIYQKAKASGHILEKEQFSNKFLHAKHVSKDEFIKIHEKNPTLPEWCSGCNCGTGCLSCGSCLDGQCFVVYFPCGKGACKEYGCCSGSNGCSGCPGNPNCN